MDEEDKSLEENFKEKMDEIYNNAQNIAIGLQSVIGASLDIYEKIPKEYKDKVSFETFFSVVAAKVYVNIDKEEEVCLNDFIDTTENIEEIPEEQLCKNCKKEKKRYDDNDFCNSCVLQYKGLAEKKENEIKEELLKDNSFLRLTNETAAKAYVKLKYNKEKQENKFIPLVTIAKETYELKKMSN